MLLEATQGWFWSVLRRAAFDEKPQRAKLNPAHKWLFCSEPAARVSQRDAVEGVIVRARPRVLAEDEFSLLLFP